jgi:hypothetical protein
MNKQEALLVLRELAVAQDRDGGFKEISPLHEVIAALGESSQTTATMHVEKDDSGQAFTLGYATLDNEITIRCKRFINEGAMFCSPDGDDVCRSVFGLQEGRNYRVIAGFTGTEARTPCAGMRRIAIVQRDDYDSVMGCFEWDGEKYAPLTESECEDRGLETIFSNSDSDVACVYNGALEEGARYAFWLMFEEL